MPWMLYLRFPDKDKLDESLWMALRFSQNIEREENGYWLDLRGPQTVFAVMGELKWGPVAMSLAPNKWLAKSLALKPGNYPPQTVIGNSWHLLHNRKELSGQMLDVLWFSPSPTGRDFYPGTVLANQAWQEWGKSPCWHHHSLESLWFLAEAVLANLQRLGFKRLEQILPLSEDFLIRETGNPYLPAYLRGESLPGLTSNYPEGFLQVSQVLRDQETLREVELSQLILVLKQLTEQLAGQLEQRRLGCLSLELEVRHEGEQVCLVREFGSPQYTWLGIYENASLLAGKLTFPSYEEVRLTLRKLQAVNYPQFALFERGTRQIPRELNLVTARYPGVLRQGIEFSRREQMLACWDPWRFTGRKKR